MPARCSTPPTCCSAGRAWTSWTRLRGFGGAQPYPSRVKDGGEVDFSTGSVGLGVAITSFASLMADYVRLHGMTDAPAGRMVAIAGDAELDEGNIYEALLEGWKHDVRNVWWIIDYNRQSLDSVVPDRLFGRIEGLFGDMAWNVVTLKYGSQDAGGVCQAGWRGAAAVDRRLPEQPLLGAHVPGWGGLAPGAAGRPRPLGGGPRDHPIRWMMTALGALMTNLGGHDLETLVEAFRRGGRGRGHADLLHRLYHQGHGPAVRRA